MGYRPVVLVLQGAPAFACEAIPELIGLAVHDFEPAVLGRTITLHLGATTSLGRS
jgi:hypothetical protein